VRAALLLRFKGSRRSLWPRAVVEIGVLFRGFEGSIASLAPRAIEGSIASLAPRAIEG
jgi:hypothetical protein